MILFFLPIMVISVFADEGFYMNEGANKGYREGFIIDQLEKISLVDCAHRCRLNDNCKHTAFHDVKGICTLLKATNFTDSGASGENIYSPVEIAPGKCKCYNEHDYRNRITIVCIFL